MSGTKEAPLPDPWKKKITFAKLASRGRLHWLAEPDQVRADGEGPTTTAEKTCSRPMRLVVHTETVIRLAHLDGDEPIANQVVVEAEAKVPEEDPILSLTASMDKDGTVRIVSAHRSLLLRMFATVSKNSLDMLATFKAQHLGPVVLLRISKITSWLYTASASTDSSIKVWDLAHQQCLQTFRPMPARPTTMETFSLRQNNDEEEAVAVGTVEGHVVVWTRREQKPQLLKKHVSPVTCLRFGNGVMLSGGRDQIIVLWSVGKIFDCLRVVPVFDNVNDLCLLNPLAKGWVSRQVALDTTDEVVVIGNESGKMSAWNLTSNKELKIPELTDFVLPNVPISSLQSSDAEIACQQEDAVVIKSFNKKTLSFYSLNESEVTDLAVVAKNFLVVTTASHIIRTYDVGQQRLSLSYCPDDVTLSVSSCRADQEHFVTAGRSKDLHVWKVKKSGKSELKMSLRGHSANIKTFLLKDRQIISADQDGIVKLWQLDGKLKTGSSLTTSIGHQKEITSLDLCEASGLLASGSLDKEVKLWHAESLAPVTTLRGHRRGVMCLAFSPFEPLLVSGSADSVFKIWQVSSSTCLQTIEGLSGVPNRVLFRTKSSLAYATSTGYLTFWDLTKKEQTTFDGHDEQVWALVSFQDELVTGGKDGQVIIWQDNAEEVERERARRKEEAIKFDQALANSEMRGDVPKAVTLALKLDRPQHTFKYLSRAYESGELEAVLQKIPPKYLPRLSNYAKLWNTISHQAMLSQRVQHFLLSNDLFTSEGAQSAQGLLLYNQRHYTRISLLRNKLALVDNLLNDT